MVRYYDDCGYGRRMGGGRGFGHRHCHGGDVGPGYGKRVSRSSGALFGESEVEVLKLYRDRLELEKKDIEIELKSVDESIRSFEKQ